MDSAMVVDIGRQALWATLLVSAPLLGVALIVGLVIGIVQAATSINEMTLSFIPKVIAMGLAILLFGSWMLGTLVEFTRAIFQRIPALFG
jgi:flagellar biosynthetic protein FliQ